MDEVLGPQDGRKRIYSDTLGEFGIATILGAELSDTRVISEASRGWRGDRVVVVREEEGGYEVVWLSRWDTPRDAREFCSAYREMLQTKYGVTGDAATMKLSDSKRVATETRDQTVVVTIFLRD